MYPKTETFTKLILGSKTLTILALLAILSQHSSDLLAQKLTRGVWERQNLILGKWKSYSKYTGDIILTFSKDRKAFFKCDSSKNGLGQRFKYSFTNGSVINIYSPNFEKTYHYIEYLDSKHMKLVSYPYDIPESISLEKIAIVDGVVFFKTNK